MSDVADLVSCVKGLKSDIDNYQKEDVHIHEEMYKRNYELLKEVRMLKNRISQIEFDKKVKEKCDHEFKDNPVPGRQAMAIVSDIIASIKRKFKVIS